MTSKNYEQGIRGLLRQIAENSTRAKVLLLREQLRSVASSRMTEQSDWLREKEANDILGELNKIAFRHATVSFSELCNDETETKIKLGIPRTLGSVLIVLIGALTIVSFGMAAGARKVSESGIAYIEMIEDKVKVTEKVVAENVTSRYYLSGRDKDPCSVSEKELGIKNIRLKILVTARHCVWEYGDIENRKVKARDKWIRGSVSESKKSYGGYFIERREYFGNDDQLIAVDVFQLEQSKCFRERTYLDKKGDEIGRACFSEAGKLVGRGPLNTFLFPIPPMFYWFIYR